MATKVDSSSVKVSLPLLGEVEVCEKSRNINKVDISLEEIDARGAPSLFRKAAELTEKLLTKETIIPGVVHIPQKFDDDNFLCRHAVVKMVKNYLVNIYINRGYKKTDAKKIVDKILPRNIANSELTIVLDDKKRMVHKEALKPDYEKLNEVVTLIRKHLHSEPSLPAIVYVTHPGGRHAVQVVGEITMLGDLIGFVFLDPATEIEGDKIGRLMLDKERKTFIKSGSANPADFVKLQEYALLGIRPFADDVGGHSKNIVSVAMPADEIFYKVPSDE
ncbi:MAG: hypothetical protein HYT75_03005 [Deltaproteobacteria bacterium]|nr:hypothetical protein [Deltaproteobacteria bacterium]